MTRESVTSADGTPIAFWRQGSGPPLLLIHGGLCDHFAWYFVAPLLAHDFTVFTFDRRGRGGSGDTLPYAVDRECEDVAAILHTVGEPAHLLGHSAGGILALEVADRVHDLRSLILYEPGYVVGGAREYPGSDVLQQMQSLLAGGDHEGALRIAMRESVGATESEIAAMAGSPGWQRLLTVASAIPNDWALWQERFSPEKARAMLTRTLVIVGTESPQWLRKGSEAILRELPNAQRADLEGQGHSAMISAPQLFVKTVTDFAL